MSDYTVELILDEIIKIRQLLETAQPSLYVSLSASQVDVEELTKQVQTALLTRAKRNTRGFRMPGTDFEGKMPEDPDEPD